MREKRARELRVALSVTGGLEFALSRTAFPLVAWWLAGFALARLLLPRGTPLERFGAATCFGLATVVPLGFALSFPLRVALGLRNRLPWVPATLVVTVNGRVAPLRYLGVTRVPLEAPSDAPGGATVGRSPGDADPVGIRLVANHDWSYASEGPGFRLIPRPWPDDCIDSAGLGRHHRSDVGRRCRARRGPLRRCGRVRPGAQ